MIDQTFVHIDDIRTVCPPVKAVDLSLGQVLGDIESHMPAGHPYRDSDRVTHAHETTHGINSRVRNKGHAGVTFRNLKTVSGGNPVAVPQAMINAFYVLQDNAVIIQEPAATLRDVARNVPHQLRGDVYQLYLVDQARDWNDRPLYVFDEWTAYANGAATRADLKIPDRGETVQYMLEFVVYAFAVAVAAGDSREDPQLKGFLRWHTERCMFTLADNDQIGNSPKTEAYLQTLRNQISGHGNEFGLFLDAYMGAAWADHTFLGLPTIMATNQVRNFADQLTAAGRKTPRAAS